MGYMVPLVGFVVVAVYGFLSGDAVGLMLSEA